jgi:bacterioferritin-associated ferredoxin
MNRSGQAPGSNPPGSPPSARKGKREVICLCNDVDRETIEKAIRSGADTLNKIFDQTTAGVGPCGGSCRRKLAPMLERYLETGEFPATPVQDSKKNRRQK